MSEHPLDVLDGLALQQQQRRERVAQAVQAVVQRGSFSVCLYMLLSGNKYPYNIPEDAVVSTYQEAHRRQAPIPITVFNPGVVFAEVRGVLRPGGRIGVVSLSAERTQAVDAYRWLHRHFPEWIDCRPISVADVLARNRYEVLRTCRVEIWRLAVVVAVATPAAA